MRNFLTIVAVCFVFSYNMFCQTTPVNDSSDESLLSGKNWISSTFGAGLNFGGGVHGLAGAVSLRFSYFGVSAGVCDFENAKFKPKDVNDEEAPNNDYVDVGFPTPLFHITGDITIPVYGKFAVKASAGACQKLIDYASKSNSTSLWYKSRREDEVLFTRFVIGGEVSYRAWDRLVVGVGGLSDYGGYVSVGWVF